MTSSNEDGTARQASTADGSDPETVARPKGRPGRKPKGAAPAIVAELPERPDPGHVLTWRQRKVLQVIRESVQRRGYPPSMREIGVAASTVCGRGGAAAHRSSRTAVRTRWGRARMPTNP